MFSVSFTSCGSTAFIGIQHGYEYQTSLIPFRNERFARKPFKSHSRANILEMCATQSSAAIPHTQAVPPCFRFLPSLLRASCCPVLRTSAPLFPPSLLLTALVPPSFSQWPAPPSFYIRSQLCFLFSYHANRALYLTTPRHSKCWLLIATHKPGG